MQEITQQQVKALEEEARTRMKADEARSARFHKAVERVTGEVENLARRLDAEENGTLQRVAKIEVCCLHPTALASVELCMKVATSAVL